MNENLKKLVEESGTYLDTSGRWANSEGVHRLYDLLIERCADIAHNVSPGVDAAAAIRQHFKEE